MSLTADRIDELLARLVDRVEGRYYGKYRGLVTDNNDPDGLGRLRARVPRVLGDVDTGWALPCVPYGGAPEQGLFAMPDNGAAVWIEFEGGDLCYPIWTGSWWGTDERPEAATPAQKVLKTASGHKLVLDDDAGSVTLTDANGNVVTLDGGGAKLEDANGNAVRMDSSGITLEDKNGNALSMGSSGVTIKAATVSIGDPATDNLVAFNMLQAQLTQFATMVQTHTHVGNLGAPTSPPVPPPVLALAPAMSHHKVQL
jgi:uncharacterized protein involved in type VI secretion and phage assembly